MQTAIPEQISAQPSDSGTSLFAAPGSQVGDHSGFGVRSLWAIAGRVKRFHTSLLVPGMLAAGIQPGAAAPMPKLTPAGRLAVARAQLGDGSPFVAIPTSRSEAVARRIVYVGDLSPASGVADVLLCAAAWAERNTDRMVSITWIGTGDLEGVLRAQPLPPNLMQTFAGTMPLNDLPSAFAANGILVVPNLTRDWPAYAVEAIASGLVVIGNARNPALRSLVLQRQTGWLFDPFAPVEMLSALDAALTSSTDVLNGIRAVARARITALWAAVAASTPTP